MFGLKTEVKINTNPSEIDDFLTRGVENIYPNKDFLKSQMQSGKQLSLYLGIDPTGPTLHMGHIIPIRKLSTFQKMGHRVVLLMGDFTAMIGDPTDKNAVRKKLSRQEVLENLKLYKKQASNFLLFDGPNKAEIKYNSEWLSKMTFGDVLELSSNVTVDHILKRDMFVKRNEEGKPTYLHEFMYPLMQGYDSVAMDIDGEVGGNDQTFNMLMGRDLVKILQKREKFVISTKILADSSGKKMGKTENNMISLDQTASDSYGKIMSWTDDLIVTGFELLTDMPIPDIENIKQKISNGTNPKELKMLLAKMIVESCYGKEESTLAEQNFVNTFGSDGVPSNLEEKNVNQNDYFVDILLLQGLVESKTEWRRLVDAGAVTNISDNIKVSDTNFKVSNGVYRIGKHRFIKVKVN